MPESFGTTAEGQDVERWTLDNGRIRAAIITWGGAIQSLEVPDRDGRPGNVVLGLRSTADYVATPAYFGAIVGRFGNRIGTAGFTLDGTAHELPANNGPNTLHGGPEGFDRRLWSAAAGEGCSVVLTRTSPDGEMGFPGTLSVEVVYTLTGDDELVIAYRATTDQATVVNLTSHSYFNLGGEGSDDVLGHRLHVPASRYTPVHEGLIPTGDLADVSGTPFDFRQERSIGERVRDEHPQLLLARGYDHNLVLDREDVGDDGLALAARVHEPVTGRVMEVRTTEPGLQLHSGNFLDGSVVGASGRAYRQGDGLCLETQHFPDSPNQPTFPSTVLRPGEVYTSRTVHRFSTD